MFLSRWLLDLIYLAVLGVEVFAVIDCVRRSDQAFTAAGKLTKPAWMAITIGAVALTLLFGLFGIFGLVAIVASIVYLVDVRPAVNQITGGGSRW